MSESSTPTGGLRHILVATVIAGAIGYLIQFLVPILAPTSYLTFATAWSAIYLVVTCLSGLQQELTRASRVDDTGSGFGTWIRFALVAAVAATAIVSVIFSVAGSRLFPGDTASFVVAIATAAFGYSLVAAVSGAVYGLKDWSAVAGMTVADSVIRAIAIAAALLAGGGALLLGWATALPFLIAVAAVWLWVGRRIRSSLALDVSFGRLLRNAGAAVVASLATGALISGLPLLLRATGSDLSPGLLASLILGITLTRAPLVVPLLALQGYLIVSFRDDLGRVALRVLKWIALFLAVVIVLAGVAALLGPLIMDWLFPDFVRLSAIDLALIVLSAGLTGLMCITGPATLAANRHSWYTAGWVVSAVITITALLLPIDAQLRVYAALLIGPLAGAVVHLIAVNSQRAAARAEPPER